VTGFSVGIDPGKLGGLSRRWDDQATTHPMPLAGGEIDLAWIRSWLLSIPPTVVVIEKAQAMPGQGVTSMFNYGKSFGSLIGLCSALEFRVELVTPQAWKKVVLAGTDKDKGAAISYCKRAFPQVSLLPTPRCSKPADGMADALCIAEFGFRTYLGGVS
jgi:crossover junction endodeoxyribonuclease RuvC